LRFFKSILNSYSIVFFSDKLIFAGILLLVSFFDYFAGFCGLISVITAYIVAESLGFDKLKIEKGLYTNPELLINYYIKNILKIALLQLNTSFDSFLNHLLLFAEKCANLNKQSLTILKIKLNDFKGLLNIID